MLLLEREERVLLVILKRIHLLLRDQEKDSSLGLVTALTSTRSINLLIQAALID